LLTMFGLSLDSMKFVTISGISTAPTEYGYQVASPRLKNRATQLTTDGTFLFIVTCAEYLRYDSQLMVVVLGALGQLLCDVEFLILIKSQARFVRSLDLLREKILHDKYKIGIQTRATARALLLQLQLGRTDLAVFCDQL
jgi:hypothetical protein